MRIHSDWLTSTNLYQAKAAAEEGGHGALWFMFIPTEHKSRSRAAAFEVALEGDGTVQRHRTQRDRDSYAATWDQWGWFIAHLFTVDPNMIAGPYKGIEDFNTRTQGAYV